MTPPLRDAPLAAAFSLTTATVFLLTLLVLVLFGMLFQSGARSQPVAC